MREIKFRGLDIERKEWVYGHYYTFGERAFIIEPGKPGIPEQHIEVAPESVGQFTGLHDKNGKEIYEGDVVQWGCPKPAVVTYNPKRMCFVPAGRNLKTRKHRSFEVIGNIYENPELLK